MHPPAREQYWLKQDDLVAIVAFVNDAKHARATSPVKEEPGTMLSKGQSAAGLVSEARAGAGARALALISASFVDGSLLTLISRQGQHCGRNDMPLSIFLLYHHLICCCCHQILLRFALNRRMSTARVMVIF